MTNAHMVRSMRTMPSICSGEIESAAEGSTGAGSTRRPVAGCVARKLSINEGSACTIAAAASTVVCVGGMPSSTATSPNWRSPSTITTCFEVRDASATLRFVASLLNAKNVVEVGTGCGISGLWTIRGMRPDGVLTSVDLEAEHQRLAKQTFTEAGIAPQRVRLIPGAALDVLPRLKVGGVVLFALVIVFRRRGWL